MRDDTAPDVSIVLACYNAETYVAESVRQIRNVLEGTIYLYELIFVDDHSMDQTVPVIRDLIQGLENCRILQHEQNLGRGRSVHDGFMAARGGIIGFIDLDLDNPARYIFSMIQAIRNGGADVSTALRVYRWKPDLYFFIRMILSKGYAALSSRILQTGLRDTETGCKFFKREKIVPILNATKDQRWFWDTEIMVRAYYAGLAINEIPTLFIRNTHVSTVNLLPETWRYLASLWRFLPEKRRLRQGWLDVREKANVY